MPRRVVGGIELSAVRHIREIAAVGDWGVFRVRRVQTTFCHCELLFIINLPYSVGAFLETRPSTCLKYAVPPLLTTALHPDGSGAAAAAVAGAGAATVAGAGVVAVVVGVAGARAGEAPASLRELSAGDFESF